MPPPDDYWNNPRYAPLYGYNRTPPMPGMFGPSNMNNSGVFGGLMQSFGPMLAEWLRGQLGGYGFTFNSGMNVRAVETARDYLMQMNAARGAGAASDRSQIEDMLRGLGRAMGHKVVDRTADGKVLFSADVEAGMSRMSSDIAGMLPVLAAMFPDTIDRIFPKGSMTVASTSFVNAGRFIRDVGTGRTIAEDKDYAFRVLDPLIQRGLKATAGLGAGRLGQTFEALAAQGLISSGAQLESSLGAIQGVFPGVGDAALGTAKNIQAKQIRDQISRYSNVIAAINDIFAENGKPDAPIAELIKGLQTMTQGGLGVYDAGTLARITRTLHATSVLSGMSMETMSMLSSSMGEDMRRRGAQPYLASTFTPYLAAMGQSYGNLGFGRPSPELMTRDQYTLHMAQRLAAGAASGFGNTMGAIFAQAEFADPGSPLAVMAAELRKGNIEANLPGFGRVNAALATPDMMGRIFAASGLDANAFLRQIANTQQNQSMMSRNQEGATRGLLYAQQLEAMNSFLAISRPELSRLVGDGNVDAFMTAMKSVMLESGLEGDASFATRLAELHPEFGLDRNKQSQLTTLFGRYGSFTGQPSGLQALRGTNVELLRMSDAEYARYQRLARQYGALQHLHRRPMTARILTEVGKWAFGNNAVSLMNVLTAAGGMTTNEEWMDALYGDKDRIDLFGMNIMGGGGLWDWIGSPTYAAGERAKHRAFHSVGDIYSMMTKIGLGIADSGPAGPAAKPAGGGGARFNPAANGDVMFHELFGFNVLRAVAMGETGSAAKPTDVKVKIDVGKLTMVGAGAVFEASGTMVGDRTAIP